MEFNEAWLKTGAWPLSAERWNPLEDDGDAFRLMVALRAASIEIRFGCDNDSVQVETWANAYDEDFGQDPDAATRRAIVRAAAEIGKKQK
jgi:hypothetical protein